MARYDYKCRECETVFEEEHSVNESPEVKCPSCSGTDTFKYMGNYDTMTVRFKGAGWAINDSALDKIGMPEHVKNSPHAKKYLDEM